MTSELPVPSEGTGVPPEDHGQHAAATAPTKTRWLIFALCCGTSFILYLHRYTWGFAKPYVREEFGWPEWQLGLLDGFFSASYAVGQIPSGILCDWFGPHLLLGSIIVLWSLSMGGVALATGITSMSAARLLFGLTQSGCYPTLSKVSKLWFPLSVRTSVQGWIATFFGRGGGAVSFFLFGSVLIGWLGLTWRGALVVLTLIGIAFAGVFLALFRNTPRDHPWTNAAEAELISEGNPEVTVATRTALRWSDVLRSGNLMVFFFQQFTSAFADNVYVYWIPLFLLTAKHVDVKAAGWMAALPLLGGAVGGTLGGMLQSYFIVTTGNRRWSRSLIGLAGKMLATVFMFVSLGFESAVVIVCIFGVVKFFSDWTQPAVWGTVTDIAGRNAASVFGTVNMVGSVAAFAAGPTMGLIIMAYSQQFSVQDEVVRAEQLASVKDVSAVKVDYARLEHMNLAEGTLRGTVYRAETRVATFEVSKGGEFSFTSVGASTAQPVSAGSRLDRIRGRLTIRWTAPPGENHLVVSYDYLDYASGWSALFVVLGLVYLASSLSWLFIDCTKKLERDEPVQ